MTTTTVLSGVTSNGIVLQIGDELIVNAGGTALGTVNSGGLETVFAGGTLSGSTVSIGSNDLLSGGELLSGGTAIDTTINSGGYQGVLSGGVATGAVVNFGGYQYVFADGTANGTTVNAGGIQYVSAGGTASGTTVTVSGMQAVTGGTAIGTVVSSGGVDYVVSGGATSGTVVNDGGTEIVFADGTANGTTVNSGGNQVVSASGVTSGTTVNNSGVEILNPGGTAIGTTVTNGGALIVLAGSVASGTMVSGGVENVLQAGVASGSIVSAGGAVNVFEGGVTSSTTVSAGGTETILGGGIANATTVEGGGLEIVSASGAASGTVVNSGGQEVVSSGGTASGTMVNSGGQETVLSGGTTSGTMVNNGGQEVVLAGGTANGTTVNSGGFEVVSAGGTANDVILNGGTVVLSAGATVSGAIDFAAGVGTLGLGGTVLPTNVISGFDMVGDSIDLLSIPFLLTSAVTLGANNVLSIAAGGTTYTLNLDPTQNFAGEVFQFSSDLSGGTRISLGLTAPIVTPRNQISNDPQSSVTGIAVPGSTVTLLANGVAVGSTTADATTGVFGVAANPSLPLGLDSLTTTATIGGGTSEASAPINLFVLQAPVAGVSTTYFSSADLGGALDNGASLALTDGTEAVLLVDSTLSVGPDTNEATIQRLYEGLLGRSNDTNGISGFDSQLAAGVSKDTVATEFLNSSEYAGIHGTQTDQEFVTSLYQGLLGRNPEDAGLAAWTAGLAQGMSRGAVAIGIADSNEAKSHLAPTTAQVYVPNAAGTLAHELFETGFGREVDAAGLQYIKALFASSTPSQIAADLTGSAEFMADHTGQNNSDYVNSLYLAGLGRPAEEAGLTGWTNALNSGALSRSDVLLDIATSTEAVGHLTHNLSA